MRGRKGHRIVGRQNILLNILRIGAVDRILWMGVFCLVAWCVAI
jgi:hypothetical protein